MRIVRRWTDHIQSQHEARGPILDESMKNANFLQEVMDAVLMQDIQGNLQNNLKPLKTLKTCIFVGNPYKTSENTLKTLFLLGLPKKNMTFYFDILRCI